MASAFVEDALRWSMESYLVAGLSDDDLRELFESEGAPLASFHDKIMVGYAIGMYGPAAKADLLAVKRIRNAFAHAPRSIDFTTSEIVQECTRLHYQEAKLNIEPKIMPVAGSIGITDPRKHFHNTVKLLLIDLHAIGAGDSKELGGMP